MNTDRKEVNGTYYHVDTCIPVINALESARKLNTRIRLYYGGVLTGASWNEEHDVCGYVGRSTGPCKIPIILHNSKSTGGSGILDHCIIRIIDSKTHRPLYSHKNFHAGILVIRDSSLPGYSHEILRNGELEARFRNRVTCLKYYYMMLSYDTKFNKIQ